jgi:hypothetical protein
MMRVDTIDSASLIAAILKQEKCISAYSKAVELPILNKKINFTHNCREINSWFFILFSKQVGSVFSDIGLVNLDINAA